MPATVNGGAVPAVFDKNITRSDETVVAIKVADSAVVVVSPEIEQSVPQHDIADKPAEAGTHIIQAAYTAPAAPVKQVLTDIFKRNKNNHAIVQTNPPLAPPVKVPPVKVIESTIAEPQGQDSSAFSKLGFFLAAVLAALGVFLARKFFADRAPVVDSNQQAVASDKKNSGLAEISAEEAPVAQWDSWGPLRVGLYALLFLFFGFGSWSLLTEIDGAVMAPGKLQVDTVKQVIQHPENGIISEILVENGDVVESGEVVIRLDDSELLSKLTIIEDELMELLAEDARLSSIILDSDTLDLPPMLLEARNESPVEIDRLIATQQARLSDSTIALQQQETLIQKQIQQTGEQIAGVEAQLAAKTDQLGAIARELKDSLLATQSGLIRKTAVYSLQKEKSTGRRRNRAVGSTHWRAEIQDY